MNSPCSVLNVCMPVVLVQLLVSECIALCAFIARNYPKLMYLICSSRLEDVPVMHQAASPALWQSILVG